MRRQGKEFPGTVTPLFATMLIQSQAVEGEGSGQPTEPQHTPTTALPHSEEPILFADSGPTTLVADETVHEERGDSVERAATTATSLDAEQGSGNINRTQSTTIPNEILFLRELVQVVDPSAKTPWGTDLLKLGLRGCGKHLWNHLFSILTATLKVGEDSMKLQELMDLCIKLSDRVLDLENVKDTQALEIKKVKEKVKKLESKKKSRTPQLKRRLFKVRIKSSTEKSLGDPENASKQERNEIDQDEGISWFQEDSETQRRYARLDPVCSTTTTMTTPIEDEYLTIAQTLMKMKSEKSKAKRVTMQEPSESGTRVPEFSSRSSKRDAEEELDQESSKRQKTGESSELAEEPRDKEADELSQEELQQMMIIIYTKAQGNTGNHQSLQIILRYLKFFDDDAKAIDRDYIRRDKHLHAGKEESNPISKGNSYIDAGSKALGGIPR
ncbi:hypothetical protein Tco_0721933 [Tanacetum coccineum]